jgi:arsenite methyltransferase
MPDLLETLCEDYGQVATYKGTIPGHSHAYELDDHHRFVAHKPMLVCGNTAAMVGDSWLGKHFDVVGNRDVHYGLFDCAPAVASMPAPAAGTSASGGSCC